MFITMMVLLMVGLGIAYGPQALEGILMLCGLVEPASNGVLVTWAILGVLWVLVFSTLVVSNTIKVNREIRKNIYTVAVCAGILLVFVTILMLVLVFGHEWVLSFKRDVSDWRDANAGILSVVHTAGWALIGASFGMGVVLYNTVYMSRGRYQVRRPSKDNQEYYDTTDEDEFESKPETKPEPEPEFESEPDSEEEFETEILPSE